MKFKRYSSDAGSGHLLGEGDRSLGRWCDEYDGDGERLRFRSTVSYRAVSRAHHSRRPNDHRNPFGPRSAGLDCTPENRAEASLGVGHRGRVLASGRETLAHVDGVGARTFWWMAAVFDRKGPRLERPRSQSSRVTIPNPKAVRERLPRWSRVRFSCRFYGGGAGDSWAATKDNLGESGPQLQESVDASCSTTARGTDVIRVWGASVRKATYEVATLNDPPLNPGFTG